MAVWLAAALPALGETCFICGKAIWVGTVYLLPDRVEERRVEVCEACHLLTDACALCRLPVTASATALPDGRFFCPRDAKAVVLETERAKELCAEARTELEQVFIRFLSLPETNVTLTIEDQVHMDQMLQAPGFERQCPYLLGYTRSRIVNDGQWKHSIGILSAQPASALKTVCAHEYAHAWLKENTPPSRVLDRDAIEGFCEWFAYKLCESLNLTREMQSLRKNGYSRGQIDLFIEAEQSHGLYAILEWMKRGVDERLLGDDLDRIRRLEIGSPSDGGRLTPRAVSATLTPLPQPMLTPVPEVLTLRGISGTGSNRLALINDRAFRPGESGLVRVSDSNVTLRCLAIQTDSVQIQVGDSDPPQELKFRTR
jgi:hypothetical protein